MPVNLTKKRIDDFLIRLPTKRRLLPPNQRKRGSGGLSFIKSALSKRSGASVPRLQSSFSRLQQNSIAKVSYLSNKYENQWKTHGRYLAREGAQRATGKGVGFNETSDAVNIGELLSAWQEAKDQRIWKVILSPEMAHKLDLKEHVRVVMDMVQRDLGCRVEWVAIDHYNTDNHHAHIVIRGVRSDGQELRLDKTYFTQGFRMRSREEATRALGFRLKDDILKKRQLSIEHRHVTEIDREIMKNLDENSVITLDHLNKDEYRHTKQIQTISRLQFLEKEKLVSRVDVYSWKVDPNLIDYLRFIQTQDDMVKTRFKHREDIIDKKLPVVFNRLKEAGDKVLGKVVGMGMDERRGDIRYLLVEGADGQLHYIPGTTNIEKKRDNYSFKNGDIIYLERREFVKRQDPVVEEGLGSESRGTTEKISYVHVSSGENFAKFKDQDSINDIDLHILGLIQKTKAVTKEQDNDPFIRKQFLAIVPDRVEYMQRLQILDSKLEIDYDRLAQTINVVRKQKMSLSMRLKPPSF